MGCYHCQYGVKINIDNECCNSDGAYINRCELEVNISYEGTTIQINYCPICGGKLDER